MTADARVRTQRKRYTFYPEEGLRIVLARLSTVGRWREMEQIFFKERRRQGGQHVPSWTTGQRVHDEVPHREARWRAGRRRGERDDGATSGTTACGRDDGVASGTTAWREG
jgi:hypothetical protein